MGLSRIIQSLKLKPKEQKQLHGGLGPHQSQQTPSSSGSKLARSSLPPEAITDSPSTDSNTAHDASGNGASDASDTSNRPGKASSERLWSQAYQDLCRRAEPGLMDEFEAQLGGQPLSNPKIVKEAVIQRLSERQNKKWHFTLMGKAHTVRDQAQRLVDLLTFSDRVVKQAVSTQPYAALAWTSVSVLLSVSSPYYIKSARLLTGTCSCSMLPLPRTRLSWTGLRQLVLFKGIGQPARISSSPNPSKITTVNSLPSCKISTR